MAILLRTYLAPWQTPLALRIFEDIKPSNEWPLATSISGLVGESAFTKWASISVLTLIDQTASTPARSAAQVEHALIVCSEKCHSLASRE